LAHYVGDLHQPLHVGAAYLEPKGRLVDPEKGTYDPNTDTRGGNDIKVGSTNLHALWDAIPASLGESHVNVLLKQAESVQATSGNVYDWPAIWASDTLGAARRAFSGIKFSGKKNGQWNATLPSKYRRRMNSIKKTQVTKAGAHLGQLLEAVWP